MTVDCASDDWGILGIDDSVPAGPLSVRVQVRVRSDSQDRDLVREVIEWGVAHCPVDDSVRRAVPIELQVDIV